MTPCKIENGHTLSTCTGKGHVTARSSISDLLAWVWGLHENFFDRIYYILVWGVQSELMLLRMAAQHTCQLLLTFSAISSC